MNDKNSGQEDKNKMMTDEQTKIAPFSDHHKSSSDEIEISAAELKDILSDELSDDDITVMAQYCDNNYGNKKVHGVCLCEDKG